MNGRENAREGDDGSCSTRRDFNVRLTALLITTFASLPLGSGSRSDHGRWILNERDH